MCWYWCCQQAEDQSTPLAMFVAQLVGGRKVAASYQLVAAAAALGAFGKLQSVHSQQEAGSTPNPHSAVADGRAALAAMTGLALPSPAFSVGSVPPAAAPLPAAAAAAGGGGGLIEGQASSDSFGGGRSPSLPPSPPLSAAGGGAVTPAAAHVFMPGVSPFLATPFEFSSPAAVPVQAAAGQRMSMSQLLSALLTQDAPLAHQPLAEDENGTSAVPAMAAARAKDVLLAFMARSAAGRLGARTAAAAGTEVTSGSMDSFSAAPPVPAAPVPPMLPVSAAAPAASFTWDPANVFSKTAGTPSFSPGPDPTYPAAAAAATQDAATLANRLLNGGTLDKAVLSALGQQLLTPAAAKPTETAAAMHSLQSAAQLLPIAISAPPAAVAVSTPASEAAAGGLGNVAMMGLGFGVSVPMQGQQRGGVAAAANTSGGMGSGIPMQIPRQNPPLPPAVLRLPQNSVNCEDLLQAQGLDLLGSESDLPAPSSFDQQLQQQTSMGAALSGKRSREGGYNQSGGALHRTDLVQRDRQQQHGHAAAVKRQNSRHGNFQFQAWQEVQGSMGPVSAPASAGPFADLSQQLPLQFFAAPGTAAPAAVAATPLTPTTSISRYSSCASGNSLPCTGPSISHIECSAPRAMTAEPSFLSSNTMAGPNFSVQGAFEHMFVPLQQNDQDYYPPQQQQQQFMFGLPAPSHLSRAASPESKPFQMLRPSVVQLRTAQGAFVTPAADLGACSSPQPLSVSSSGPLQPHPLQPQLKSMTTAELTQLIAAVLPNLMPIEPSGGQWIKEEQQSEQQWQQYQEQHQPPLSRSCPEVQCMDQPKLGPAEKHRNRLFWLVREQQQQRQQQKRTQPTAHDILSNAEAGTSVLAKQPVYTGLAAAGDAAAGQVELRSPVFGQEKSFTDPSDPSNLWDAGESLGPSFTSLVLQLDGAYQWGEQCQQQEQKQQQEQQQQQQRLEQEGRNQQQPELQDKRDNSDTLLDLDDLMKLDLEQDEDWFKIQGSLQNAGDLFLGPAGVTGECGAFGPSDCMGLGKDFSFGFDDLLDPDSFRAAVANEGGNPWL